VNNLLANNCYENSEISQNWIMILMSVLIAYLINVRKVLILLDDVSQRLVDGFWTLILLRNQISNWNHVSGRAGPSNPQKPITGCSVFLFRFASLLCLFIYLSIYPYLFSTLRNHRRPSGRARAQIYTYTHTQRCDATKTMAPSSLTRETNTSNASPTLFNFGFLPG
jgi:hypothetical protein